MSTPLDALLEGLEVLDRPASRALTVSGLAYDSRRLQPGDLFFALPGGSTDGGRFLAEAAARGAAAAVGQDVVVGAPLPLVVVRDAREAMGRMAAAFHAYPARNLRTIGVTGTNGKTTTAFLCKHILDAAQRRCGLVGTIKYVVGDREIEAPRTTPESPDLQALLAEMRDEGCKSVAMEVSSHSLVQGRVSGVEFDVAVFTNLTQDHLDYHKSMESYFEAKALLFESAAAQEHKVCRGVVNADDRFGHRLVERFTKKLKILTFGFGASADFRATDLHTDAQGSRFHLAARGRSYLVRLPLIGNFNIANALASLAATAALGLEVRAAVAALASAPQVPGRLERVPAKRSFQVFVDYAHTDDALRNVLSTLSNLQPHRLLVVVGCGGDRDRAKRPLMAAVAEEFADWTILTSDNPRSEDPEQILADMRAGLRADHHEVIPARDEAIRRAVDLAEPGDLILIAGKGHETYQELASGRVPFDDSKIARRAIEAKRLEFEEEEEDAWKH